MLKNGCGLDVELSSNFEQAAGSGIPVINYSSDTLGNSVNIRPHSLLNDTGLKDYVIEVSSDSVYQKIFFKTQKGDIPFDFFSAAFWLITRYEEYLPHKTDQFNRFHYKSSLAYQYDFLETPLVNAWLCEFKKLLASRFPELMTQNRVYNFISSVDIDNAFRYRHKGLVRTIAGVLADLLRKDFHRIRERFEIIRGKKSDPFDVYDFLISAHREKNVSAIYFILLGDYGINDKNHSANNFPFQELIKHLADYSAVGIHPSFGSNEGLQKLKVEISRLANITHFPVVKSRQHFSMLTFPSTYQNLLQSGITDDYSLGYTNRNGFRASYCYPFNWYSLDDEQEMALKIHPFCITENTLAYYSTISGRKFDELAEPLIASVKKYGGELISVFHNDAFTDEMKSNYLSFLERAKV